jgi:hypothetical protein
MRSGLIFSLLCCAVVAVAVAGEPPDHAHVAMAAPSFGKLDGLIGRWEAKMPDGKTATTSFEKVAGGTALLERMQVGDEPAMVTMYVRDRQGIALTHYCTTGNQPHMVARDASAASLEFEFKGASGLDNPATPHMHHVTFTVADADHFSEEWTLKHGSGEQKTAFTFARVP